MRLEQWAPTRLTCFDPSPTTTPVVQLSAIGNHYIALKQDGTVWELGYIPALDPSGLVGIGLDYAYPFQHYAGLEEVMGVHTNVPQRVLGLPAGIVSVAAAYAYSAAITQNGGCLGLRGICCPHAPTSRR